MKKEQDISSGIDKLSIALSNAKKKISDAIRETKRHIPEADKHIHLFCIQKDKVDFTLIEKDVKNIHAKLRSDGFEILGSHLVIDDKNDYIEIKTYIQKGEKTSMDTIKIKVKSIQKLPNDIYQKLQDSGRVELHLKAVN